MTWKIITPEEVVSLPLHRELGVRMLPGVQHGEGYYQYRFTSTVRLTDELRRRLEEEIEAEIRRINGLPPDASLIPPPH